MGVVVFSRVILLRAWLVEGVIDFSLVKVTCQRTKQGITSCNSYLLLLLVGFVSSQHFLHEIVINHKLNVHAVFH